MIHTTEEVTTSQFPPLTGEEGFELFEEYLMEYQQEGMRFNETIEAKMAERIKLEGINPNRRLYRGTQVTEEEASELIEGHVYQFRHPFKSFTEDIDIAEGFSTYTAGRPDEKTLRTLFVLRNAGAAIYIPDWTMEDYEEEKEWLVNTSGLFKILRVKAGKLKAKRIIWVEIEEVKDEEGTKSVDEEKQDESGNDIRSEV